MAVLVGDPICTPVQLLLLVPKNATMPITTTTQFLIVRSRYDIPHQVLTIGYYYRPGSNPSKHFKYSMREVPFPLPVSAPLTPVHDSRDYLGTVQSRVTVLTQVYLARMRCSYSHTILCKRGPYIRVYT